MRVAFVAALLLNAGGSDPVSAQPTTTTQMITMGQRTWAFYQCAAYAAFAKDTAQHQRLFLAGLQEGRRFIAAVKANPGKWPEVYEEIPIIVGMGLEGPTPDFMLGSLWAQTMDLVGDKVWERLPGGGVNPNGPDEKHRVLNAQLGFREHNCQLL